MVYTPDEYEDLNCCSRISIYLYSSGGGGGVNGFIGFVFQVSRVKSIFLVLVFSAVFLWLLLFSLVFSSRCQYLAKKELGTALATGSRTCGL